MIQFKIQEKLFTPNIGDISPFQDRNILKAPPEKDEDKYLCPIGDLLNQNIFKTLTEIGIDIYDLEQKYECPHSGMEFYSLVPLYLYSSDLTKYNLHEEFSGIATDKEWIWDRCYSDKGYLYDKIDKAMLGTGYTFWTNQNDGSNDYIVVSIELDNGDEIICLTWNWFNK